MVRLRPTNTELLVTLQGLNKPYFTIADLQKLLGLSGKSLLVTVRRLVDAGVLHKLRRNTYTLASAAFDAERVAGSLYYPAYLSFESALARYGILSQIPHSLTFATTRPSKRITMGTVEAEFSHLKAAFYFGYTSVNGLDVAEPEKALLDQLYLVSRGLRQINIAELDLQIINRDKLVHYAVSFPVPTSKIIEKVMPLVHTTPVTNQNAERVGW